MYIQSLNVFQKLFSQMSLFKDYEQYTIKYQQIYGPKTVVLYQNGMFYEVYGIDNAQEKVGLVKEVSDMLNIQMTRRDKSNVVVDRSNFLMAGFPTSQLDRYASMLTEDNGYVVVVVAQLTPPPKPTRGVLNIISPSTGIKYISKPNANYLMSIYIEGEGHVKSIGMITIGIASIDVSTGKNYVYEISNVSSDERIAYDETYRLIHTLQPTEIIVNTRNITTTESDLITQFDLNNSLIHFSMNNVPKDYHKLSYQNEFLGRIFTNTGLITPIEYVNLEQHPVSIISYLLLLNYCYQQKETMIDQIQKPTIMTSTKNLILDNNSIIQLNLINVNQSQKNSSLLSLLDHTSTAMGKRLLKEKLLLPLIDPDQINRRYDYVESLRQVWVPSENQDVTHLPDHQQYYKYQHYELYLKNIGDIERLHRKMCVQLLQPSEWTQLHQSYQTIHQLAQIVSNPLNCLMSDDLVQQISQYIEYYTKIIDIDEITKYNLPNLDGCVFRKGYDSNIDQMKLEIDHNLDYFKQLCNYINTVSGKTVVEYVYGDDLGYHLEMTVARYNTFDSKCPETFTINGEQQVKKELDAIKNRSGKTCKITSPHMKEISATIKSCEKDLSQIVKDTYKSYLTVTYQKYHPLMTSLVQFISQLDMYKSFAKCSLLYNYCRPTIVPTDRGTIHAVQLRHPLIERIQTTCPYVPQDIEINGEQSGILLFGVNSVGKSSTMKAIGVSVIMAQSGMYVPAKEYKYSPYHTVLTRILGNDNLFKGMSSFAVEMSELRGIINRANQYSLVLGDEICHGTETISAVSIVSASIITLSQKQASFLFATHLHQVAQIESITGLKNVKMYHLKVSYDNTNNRLIYDRILTEGTGSPVYGLEVAKAMNLAPEFIQLANQIRHDLMNTGELVTVKQSKYNKEMYMGQCQMPKCTNPAEVTHHIQFQSSADNTGYISHMQKNHKSNLIAICKSCHDKLHYDNKIVIKGYQMTSDGPKLIVKPVLRLKSVPK